MATAKEVSPKSRDAKRIGLSTYILVACVAGSSLGLELIQTRILSFLYFNNVAYLTVTVALLGFGISGVIVSLFSSRIRRPERMISLLAAGFAISSFACLAVVSRIPAIVLGHTTIKLLVSYIALVIPFLFSGAVLGWIFMLRAQGISRLYAVDLATSSGAVVAFLLLLWPIGGDWFVWLCTGLALIGFLAFSHTLLPASLRVAVTAICLISVAVLNNNLLSNKPEAYKWLARAYDRGVTTAKVEATAWTPITRIDLWSDSAQHVVSRARVPEAAETKMITQDADAFTMLWGPRHVSEVSRAASRGDAYDALSITYLLNKKPKDSLVIGVGGGVDMMTAKVYGAQTLTGVEINPATVALVSGPYRDFLQWPKWDGVNLVRAEGRNYVRSKRDAYDTIVMSGVDTFSALNAGALVLSENYLYTVEAVEDYLRALKGDGTMAIFRWFFFKGPRETLRLTNIFRTAAENLGIAHPDQCLMVIAQDTGLGGSDFHWAATFLKKRPFTPAEVDEALKAVASVPTLSAAYLPKVFPPDIQAQRERKEAERDPSMNVAQRVFNHLLTANSAERSAFIRTYPYRIDAVYDDRPFFFQYYKPGGHTINVGGSSVIADTSWGALAYYVLYLVLAMCAIICLVCILGPLWYFERRGLEMAGSIPLVLYFACLGAGYMTFELGAMQVLNLYLGDPAYSLAVVLAGLLVATGAGAALSTRFSGEPVKVISVATAIVAIVIVSWLAWNSFFTTRTMQFPLAFRAVATLIFLFPVGIALGIPFPTAVKALEHRNPTFIAWAWGVNGVTSVLASILAIIVAMRVGFKVVVCIAAATYLIAMLSYRWYSRRSKDEPLAAAPAAAANIA